MTLKDKVVKIKKLQRSANSYMILIPELWLRELDWTRETKLKVMVQLGNGIITIEKLEENGQKTSSD